MKTQRDTILQVIREAGRHMNADEIYLACRAKGIRVSVATVYRNLNIMAENHILRRFPISGKPDCYDVTVADHGHKVCRVCGQVSDIDVGNTIAVLAERLGLVMTDYDLCLRYICPECQEKTGRKTDERKSTERQGICPGQEEYDGSESHV